jgi:hypothetical protein
VALETTKLTAQDEVILFCTATGISHVAVGIALHAMHSMAVRGSSSMIARAGDIRSRIADALRSLRPLGNAG